MHFENCIIKDLFVEDADPDRFEIIEKSVWKQSGKYQFSFLVFKFEGKFYRATEQRSGSPFSEWYYDWEDRKDNEMVEVIEVEKKEVTITKWEPVK